VVFLVAELNDIPYGPCLGFYVAAESPSTGKIKKEKKTRYDDDDDDNQFVDKKTGLINFAAVRAAIASAKPISRAEMNRRFDDNGDNDDYLVPERRFKNITDREEGRAIQYLVLGGYRHYVCAPNSCRHENHSLIRACSALHSGPGQQTFGWDKTQRADLLLHFESKSETDDESRTSILHYHNHHEMGSHYSGHEPDCSRADDSYCPRLSSIRADDFKRGLARALTSVRPERAVFLYSTTTSCQLEHGHRPRVGSTLEGSSQKFNNCLEACRAERKGEFLHVSDADRKEPLNVKDVLAGIADGSLSGFVTIRGGEEMPSSSDSRAGKRFGFCVQKYAPPWSKISSFTKKQIADYHGFEDEASLTEFVKKQAPRTVNSGTFHVWETVTTSYLRWLMNVRKFANFEIRHLLVYQFGDDPKHFLEPILQRRHDAKRAGNAVEAECLKLIGNGSFGYNGLEITNYNSVRLMRESTYRRERYKGLAHRNLKHTTMLSLIRTKIRPKAKREYLLAFKLSDWFLP